MLQEINSSTFSEEERNHEISAYWRVRIVEQRLRVFHMQVKSVENSESKNSHSKLIQILEQG